MNIQKYTPPKIEFCTDYGEQPLLLAHVTKDRSMIAVLSLLGGFVAMAAVGFPGALLVGFAALNDISYAAKVDSLGDAPEAVKTDPTAIDVTATTVENDQGANQSIAAAPTMQHIVSPVWNPAEDLGQNPQSALIVGVPGSGKGMLVSNAIRTLKAKYPDLKIFVIDPKADPKERGYWEGLADHYKAFSLMKCSDPDEGAEWLLDCMAQFTAMSGPKLCIFDELMSASTELSLANKELKALPRLKKFVVGLIGQGDSQGAWLWAMTQSPQVADMGMSGGVRANLRAIGLVSPKNLAAVEAMTSTKLIPPPPGGMDELRQIMEASPVNRAVFDGKLARWLPMPKLENHSGFDRDSRTITREVTPIAPAIVATMDPIARLENAYQAPAVEVQIQAVVSTRPDGLDEYPLIGAVWEYLLGKEPRSLKTTADAIRKSGRISMDVLEVKIPHVESFTDGIRQVLDYGIYKGFIVKVSDDAYQAAEKH